MTATQLDDDIATWSGTFQRELEAHAKDLENEGSCCGFAIEMPSDFGGDGIISSVAKRQDGKPDFDDWDYIPNGKTFDKSCDELMELCAKYDEQFDDESFQEDFANRLYTKILGGMKTLVSDGNFQNIELWLLTLSDGEHPILVEAATTLNDASKHDLAKSVIA